MKATLDASMVEIVRSTMEAEQLMRLISERAPELSTGNDPEEAVTATIDRSGALISLDIAEDWSSRITSGSLSASVMSALSTARTLQFSAVSQSTRSFENPKVSTEEAKEYLEARITELTKGTSFGPATNVVDSAEEFIAFSQLTRQSADNPRTPLEGHVRVTKQAGIVTSIEVDEEWARARSGKVIAMAILTEATRHESARPEDDMLFSIMSTLTRLAERN